MSETCRKCNCQYDYVWEVSDKMWKLVTKYKHGEGLLCLPCFDLLARNKCIIIKWTNHNQL